MQRCAPFRNGLVLALASLVFALGACCSNPRAPEPEPVSHDIVTDRPVAPDAEPVEPLAPIPATFDCAAPPPLSPCCRALLPKCTECAERNRAIDEAYRGQCGVR